MENKENTQLTAMDVINKNFNIYVGLIEADVESIEIAMKEYADQQTSDLKAKLYESNKEIEKFKLALSEIHDITDKPDFMLSSMEFEIWKICNEAFKD